jgi:hypothetical protein
MCPSISRSQSGQGTPQYPAALPARCIFPLRIGERQLNGGARSSARVMHRLARHSAAGRVQLGISRSMSQAIHSSTACGDRLPVRWMCSSHYARLLRAAPGLTKDLSRVPFGPASRGIGRDSRTPRSIDSQGKFHSSCGHTGRLSPSYSARETIWQGHLSPNRADPQFHSRRPIFHLTHPPSRTTLGPIRYIM